MVLELCDRNVQLPDIIDLLTLEQVQKQRFEALFVDVYEPLQRYIRRRVEPASVDDVLSETLLVAWRRLSEVPEEGSLPWCYGVARRVIGNHRRSAARRLRLADKVKLDTSVLAPVATDGGDFDMEVALSALADSEKELLRLWAWEALEPREIAVVLNTTPNAVSSRLKRAKRKLSHEMERQKSLPSGHLDTENTPRRNSGER